MLSTQQNKLSSFLDKLEAGKTLYLMNTYEQAVIKFTPKDGTFIKYKGKQEAQANAGSEVVADAMSELKEVTEEQYNKY